MLTRNPSAHFRLLAGLARLLGAAVLVAALYGGFRAWLAPDTLLSWLAVMGFCG